MEAEKHTLLTATTVLGAVTGQGLPGQEAGPGDPQADGSGGCFWRKAHTAEFWAWKQGQVWAVRTVVWAAFLFCQMGTAVHGLSVPVGVGDVNKSSGCRVRSAVSVSPASRWVSLPYFILPNENLKTGLFSQSAEQRLKKS